MIHVLGAGNIGSLVAVALSQRNAVELLLKPSSLKRYKEANEKLRIHVPRPGGAVWESSIPATTRHALRKPIKQMVVTLKAYSVKSVLSEYVPLLTRDSEVLLLHNGLGVAEEVKELWPDGKGPRLSFGVTDAGVKRLPPYGTFAYTGNGLIRMNGRGPLSDAFLAMPGLLVAERLNDRDLTATQHEKLVVNATINPLTAILSCPNGALLSLDRHYFVQRLISECSRVLGLDPGRMISVVNRVIEKTASNTSSMLADVEAGRPSEVDYINGYIVRRAQLLGMSAPMNKMLRDLVLMRTLQARHELDKFVPLELD